MRHWQPSSRGDKRALPLADVHYSRQKPGTSQFVQPGSCCVFLTEKADALWVTVAPFAQYVKHAWRGAWQCSMFHNRSEVKASELILEAVALTRGHYGEPPSLGMVTFVDPKIIKGTMVRTQDGPMLLWGYSFQKAGFKLAECPKHEAVLFMSAVRAFLISNSHLMLLLIVYKFTWCKSCEGLTEDGLVALQLLPKDMPEPLYFETNQLSLIELVA